MKSFLSLFSKDSRWETLFLSMAVIAVILITMLDENLVHVYSVLGLLSFAICLYLLFFNKRLLIYFIFFIVPFSYISNVPGTGMSISLPSEMLATLLSLIALYYLLIKHTSEFFKILKHPISILFIVNILIMLFMSFTSTMVDVSIKRTLMRANFLIMGFYFMILWMKEPGNLLKPFLFHSIGLAIVILLILKTHARYDFNPRVVFSVSQPYYADHTVYGACIAYLLPIYIYLNSFFQKKNIRQAFKIFSVLLVVILLTGEVLALSRAAWLSVIVMFFFYLLLKIKVPIWSYFVIIIVALSTVFSLKDELIVAVEKNETVSNDGNVSNHITSVTNVKTDASNMERINRWVCAWRMFEEKPLTGYGPGTYQFEYGQFQTSEYRTYISTNSGDRGNAHSEYLTYLSETGIFGFISFLVIVLYTLYKGISLANNSRSKFVRNISTAIILGISTFYFHGIFNAFIDQDKMALLVFPSLAALTAIDMYHKHKTDQEIFGTESA